MLAGMHFMDSYNYDVERVKRCVIHYAAPNGRIYPFCAYNSGPSTASASKGNFRAARTTGRSAQATVKAKNNCGPCTKEPELVG